MTNDNSSFGNYNSIGTNSAGTNSPNAARSYQPNDTFGATVDANSNSNFITNIPIVIGDVLGRRMSRNFGNYNLIGTNLGIQIAPILFVVLVIITQ